MDDTTGQRLRGVIDTLRQTADDLGRQIDDGEPPFFDGPGLIIGKTISDPPF